MVSQQDGNRHLFSCCCFCCLSIICFIDTAQHLLWSLAVKSYVGLVCIIYFVWKRQCFLCCCTLQPNTCQNVAEMLFRVPSSGQPASSFQNRAHAESRLWVLTTLSLKFCCLSKNTPHSEAVLYLLTRQWMGEAPHSQPQSPAGAAGFQTQRWRRQHCPGDSSGWGPTLLVLGWPHTRNRTQDVALTSQQRYDKAQGPTSKHLLHAGFSVVILCQFCAKHSCSQGCHGQHRNKQKPSSSWQTKTFVFMGFIF